MRGCFCLRLWVDILTEFKPNGWSLTARADGFLNFLKSDLMYLLKKQLCLEKIFVYAKKSAFQCMSVITLWLSLKTFSCSLYLFFFQLLPLGVATAHRHPIPSFLPCHTSPLHVLHYIHESPLRSCFPPASIFSIISSKSSKLCLQTLISLPPAPYSYRPQCRLRIS